MIDEIVLEVRPPRGTAIFADGATRFDAKLGGSYWPDGFGQNH
jgi:hypothetical protein